MLYYLLKPIVRIFYKIYYQLDVRGVDGLPDNKPLVLIPNHVNGFIDPVVTALFSKQKIRFFARGDVFKGRFVKWLLNDLNISPMYRMSEGYSEVKKNDKTFEECRRLLTEGKSILIFPEGICIQERRIQKLKKGLARIVLGVEEELVNKEDIQVIPIGLNYSNASRFRSRLLLRFGEPIPLSQFHARYASDKVKTINECTQFIEGKMRELIVEIENPANDRLYEALTEVYTKQWMEESGLPVSDQLEEHEKNKLLAAMLNNLQKSNPAKVEALEAIVLPYLSDLKRLGLRDHLLRRDALSKMNLQSTLGDFFKLWFGLPVYWIGLLLNYPPYRLARRMADEKAKTIVFYSSVFANLAMFFWIPYYLLQLLFLAQVFHSWWLLLAWALLVPLSGLFVIRFYSVRKKAFGRWKLLGLVKKNKAEAERLIYAREEIVELIKEGLKSTSPETFTSPG